MSETPMSLIDDKKSSQVTYNTDQIMDNEEARRAFFTHAESGNLFTPKPPEFDLNEDPKAFDANIMVEANDQSFAAETPVYAQEPITHKDTLERAYHYMDTHELVADARICTKAVVMTRNLY